MPSSVIRNRTRPLPANVMNNHFHILVENLPEGILAEDSLGKITFANRRFCEMLGLSVTAGELAGLDTMNAARQNSHAFADSKKFLSRIEEVVRQRKAVVGEEVWLANGKCMERDYIPILNGGEYDGCFWKYRDVTRQKQDEARLRKNEELYRLLSESSRDVVALHRPDYRYLYVSPSVQDVAGYDPAELIGESPLDYIHPDDLARVTDAHERAFGTTAMNCIRYRMRRKDGEYLWMETHLRMIRDDNGILTHLQTSSRDISLRAQAEEKLKRSDDNLKALLATTEDTIYSITTDFQLITCNSAFSETILKYAGVQISAGDYCPVTLLPPEVQSEWIEYYRRVFAGERFCAVSQSEHFGQTVCYEHFFNPIFDLKRQVTGASVFGRNITSRIEAEKQIREQSQLLGGIIANLPVIVFRTDPSGVFTQSRGAGLRGLGLEDNQAVGQNLYDMFPHLKEQFDAMYQTEIVSFTAQGGEPDNEWCFENHIFRDEDGSGCVTGFAWDASKEKVVEKALRRSADEMSVLNADKDKLFSIISHDLRGPLTGMLGITDLLGNGLDTLSDEEIRLFATNLHVSAMGLLKLLDNLLEWALNESGRMTYDPQPTDMRQLCEEVLDLMRLNLKNKGISLHLDIRDDACAQADRRMAQSVLRNLLSNAIKFTPAGGQVTIGIANDAPTGDSGQNCQEWLKISIMDTGTGMDEDTLNALFDTKVRHSARGTAGEKGTGLGLSLCRDFVARHGGRIWAESREGEGSCLQFTLPKVSVGLVL